MRLCSASSHWALHIKCFDTTSFTSMLMMPCLLKKIVKFKPIKNAAES